MCPSTTYLNTYARIGISAFCGNIVFCSAPAEPEPALSRGGCDDIKAINICDVLWHVFYMPPNPWGRTRQLPRKNKRYVNMRRVKT